MFVLSGIQAFSWEGGVKRKGGVIEEAGLGQHGWKGLENEGLKEGKVTVSMEEIKGGQGEKNREE